MAELALEQPRLRISAETLIYLALVTFVIVVRVAALGALPLDDQQAHEALAALHRVDPNVPTGGEESPALYPHNALGALFNAGFLMILGHGDAVARLATALAGVLLVLSPLLYRPYVGKLPALLMALGLAFSPVALAASRSMSGLIWALLLLMIGGWLLLRFVEERRKGQALAATVCAAGVLFLTTPYGLLVLLGVFFGLALAVITSAPEHPARRLVPEIASVWSGAEAFIASLLAIIVVATSFFTQPAGLSSVGQIPQVFLDGLTERQPGAPWMYGLLVSLRYDFAFVLFALIAVWIMWSERRFVERFLTGWLLWSLVAVTVYPGATADIALIVTLPAVALTALLVARMLRNVSFGYWHVPEWVLPLHALVVMGLLASLGVNLRSLALKLWEEAKIVPYAEVLYLYDNSGTTRLGTLQNEAQSSSMSITLPAVQLENCRRFNELPPDTDTTQLQQSETGLWCERQLTYDLTAHLYPIDDEIQQAAFVIQSITGEVYFRADEIGDGVKVHFEAPGDGEYRLEVVRTPAFDQLPAKDYEFGLNIFPGNLTDKSGFSEITSGAFRLRFPMLVALTRILIRPPNAPALLVAIFMPFMILLSFFLSGAFYGSRAAWRGVGLGILGYGLIYGLAVGWNATTHFNARELWSTHAATEDYHSLQATLNEYSRRENGTLHEIEVTVEGRDDSALAWALRDFPNARFVERVTYATTSPAVITAGTQPPSVGADYVGQELILGYHWSAYDLTWTDFGAWLFLNRSHDDPLVTDTYRLWITKEVYDVQKVPGQE